MARPCPHRRQRNFSSDRGGSCREPGLRLDQMDLLQAKLSPKTIPGNGCVVRVLPYQGRRESVAKLGIVVNHHHPRRHRSDRQLLDWQSNRYRQPRAPPVAIECTAKLPDDCGLSQGASETAFHGRRFDLRAIAF
jgi:hypothetical protein